TSGEVLTESVSKLLCDTFPNTEFYNVYGLTEHSPRVSALLPVDYAVKPGSVGKPIGDVRIKIERGELLVKSDSVMKGYYHDETLTADKIQNGWLHTGDRARMDADGYLYIDGRLDGMLIKAGINVYPEEIEKRANEIEGVSECVVYGERVDNATVIGMKYVGTIGEKELRRELVGILNPNIVPTRIEKAEELARTASGKKMRV
ncbi:MAG: class I adenylate-forming enzyme family protein, partial [Christensenellales bacterium]